MGCAFLVFVGWGCIFTGSGLSVAIHSCLGPSRLFVPDGLFPSLFLLVLNGVALWCGFLFFFFFFLFPKGLQRIPRLLFFSLFFLFEILPASSLGPCFCGSFLVETSAFIGLRLGQPIKIPSCFFHFLHIFPPHAFVFKPLSKRRRYMCAFSFLYAYS